MFACKSIVVENAEELKSIKARKITWKKDRATMVRMPEKWGVVPAEVVAATYDKFGDLIMAETIIPERKIQVGDAFYMDAYQVTVGQFEKFLRSSSIDKGTIQELADNQGNGTNTATYTATDTVGEAEVTAVTENGVIGTIKLKLIETVVSVKKSILEVTSGAPPETGESIAVSVQLLDKEEIALSGKSVKLKISPSEDIEVEDEAVKTDKEGKAELKFTANSKGVKKISVVSGEVELEQTRAVIVKQGQPPLVGGVNGDGTVNIFDLVIAAGQFGQAGDDLEGDVNADGAVNIFDLVLVAGNFGQSAVTAAPSMVAKIELSTDQKHHITSAIDQLESNSSRSNEEEALNVLKAILPKRLPTQTQLLANYPNPFNPEPWIPFKLAQDSTVIARIYDVTGKQIRMIELGHIPAGSYVESSKAIYWDGKTDTGEQVSSGTYFYQIEAGDYTETRKMVILK